MHRREALKVLLATGGSLLAASVTRRKAARGDSNMRMPAIFLAHGSPMLLDDAPWVSELHRWAGDLPRPKAILMLSAHWEQQPIALGATCTVPLVYDFYGFPAKYYEVRYAAPGAPELAARVGQLLSNETLVVPTDRGLDHGAYVPLIAMYPQADVPVLQLSLPVLDPQVLFRLGRTLAPLRAEGVLIVGSGFLTHNLRALDLRPQAPTLSWAKEFDHWTADVLQRGDVDALLDYRNRAPGVDFALPTHEHFVPVIVAFGAAVDAAGGTKFPISGFLAGSLTRRSVQFG